MNKGETSEGEPQVIRIASPSKEDVEYVKDLYKKGTVKEEDLRPNMSIITPHQESEDPN